MAANKGKETIEALFNEVIYEMAENGSSLYSALKGRLSSATFYDYLDENEDRLKKYARATELRAEKMAEETLEISDNQGEDVTTDKDGKEYINHNVINRDRLRVDTRKWLLAKLHPKKYGDRTILAGDKENPLMQQTIIVQSVEAAENLKELKKQLNGNDKRI